MAVARKEISRAALKKLLTDQIRQIEDLADATLSPGYLLKRKGVDGCNWSTNYLLNAGSNADASYARPYEDEIVQTARAKYNIKD